MASTTQRLGIDIVASDKTLAGFASVQKQLNGLTGGVQRAVSGLKSLAGALGVGFGVGAGFQAVVSALKSAADLGDVAENIGITAEQIQVYNRMALAAGSTTDQMARALQELTEQSVEAGSKLDKLFAANGIKVKGMEANQVIRTFTELLKNARNPAEQLEIASSVLGARVGRDLVEAFRTGATGIDDATKAMVESGVYHTNAELKRLQDIETRYNELSANVETIWQSMILRIADGLGALAAASPHVSGSPQPGMIQTRYGYRPAPLGNGLVPPSTIPNVVTGPGKGDLPAMGAQQKWTVLPPPDVAKAKAGLSEVEKALQKLKAEGQSVWESTRSPIEKYQIEVRRLNDLLSQGVIDQDTYGRAVKNLQDDFSNAADAAKAASIDIGQIFGDALANVASQADSLSSAWDAFKMSGIDAIRAVASEWIKSGIAGLFNPAVAPSQAGGGFLSGLGSLFGGFFAGGGNLGAGKWGIAGEAGPEMIRGPASITPLSAGGATTVHYAPNITIQGGGDARQFAEVLRRDRERFARDVPGIIRQARKQGKV